MYNILIILCILLLSCSNQVYGQKLDPVPLKRVISLELKEKPLKKIVEDIQKQTGYTIVFDEKWNDLLISGQYTGVTLEEFFQRALRKQNISLSYSDKGNVVNLCFFGDRTVTKAKDSSLAKGIPFDLNEKNSNTTSEILTTYYNDPESIDPSSGMTLVDMRELHATQMAELDRFRNDPESIDPMNGMKLGDIRELHNAQQAEITRFQNDPESIDPVSGLTNAEMKQRHNL